MSIHPAVAPSGATGLAGSLMRRHRRLLQERSLSRQFLSVSKTTNQVREKIGEERLAMGVRKSTIFLIHII